MNNPYVRYILVFALALLLQATFIKFIEILNWSPDLILIVLVMFALQFGQSVGTTAGFLIGVLGDLISGGLLGLGALSKTITGFIAGGIGRFFQERSQFIFTLFIAGFTHDLIFYYINTLGGEISWLVILFKQIIPNLFYTALVGTSIYFIIGNWLKGDE
ncbi:MAG: rod shape-determining protein MreD [Calditrichae bacterium]|nr:rod shape-determining protein MreD [Calditrichia bacterium]